ncbi:glycerophosphoinositol inositolphosphodiesterase GDPD2-like isoform X2 [Plectropomus leopardus]|uniref:glycerophosphoinositol inositolphosphodiesterase GDPD2-like isoform X2 n=1 Tax=Plectropomus leopardus TaxID=160734 RepID=UPI001C4CDD13|nr:glycerophosphoinositol inositolphosphodiesterase GDPD2-like isoform X2 [Plectropomus leopardus]
MHTHIFTVLLSIDSRLKIYVTLLFMYLANTKLYISKAAFVFSRELRRKNITVNLWVVNERWLFSVLWCAGASSVTTNSCHLLKVMERPDWILAPLTYKIIWITVDIVSILIMTGLYIFRWERQAKKQYFSVE